MAIQTEKAETGKLTPGSRLSLARMFFSKGGPGELLGFLLSAAKEYGPVVGFRYLNRSSILLDHPDHIRHVLRANNRNYVKSKNYEPVKLVVGKGLVVSEGDFWRRQRRLVQPAFHRRRIAPVSPPSWSPRLKACSRGGLLSRTGGVSPSMSIRR